MVFLEHPGSGLWCLTLVWGNSQSFSAHIFLPFLLFSESCVPSHAWCTFVAVPHPWRLCSGFCRSLFSLLFIFQGFFGQIFQLGDLSSATFGLISPSEAFFISASFSLGLSQRAEKRFCHSFYLQHFFLILSWNLYLCSHCPSVLVHHSLCQLEPLHVNHSFFSSWSCTGNAPAMSGSDAFSVSWNSVFARHDVLSCVFVTSSHCHMTLEETGSQFALGLDLSITCSF